MPFLTRLVFGLIAMSIGFLMVYKTEWILELVGRIYFAEKNFGPGGTRVFYKMLGTLIILLGFLFITNLFDVIVGGFLTRIFG